MNTFTASRVVGAAVIGFGLTGAAQAASVTPDIIFGDGNDNGEFTVTNTEVSFPSNPISGNIELGLRAKLRYDDSVDPVTGFGSPQNTFNWDGDKTYNFNLADTNAPANRAAWNFEWSVNIQDLTAGENQVSLAQLVSSGAKLILAFDTDPSAGTSFSSYNVTDAPAYYGTNATGNGGAGSETTTIPADATVAQQSVNYGFIPGAPLGAGTFDISLTAFSFGDAELASTSITVNVADAAPVPVPAALPLLLAGFGGLAFVARRRKAA